jgi:hypothetical protein
MLPLDFCKQQRYFLFRILNNNSLIHRLVVAQYSAGKQMVSLRKYTGVAEIAKKYSKIMKEDKIEGQRTYPVTHGCFHIILHRFERLKIQ